MRFREAKKHTDATDPNPDPEHRLIRVDASAEGKGAEVRVEAQRRPHK
jgi:hypothetical protein